MSYIINNTSAFVNIKLTEVGRQKLAQGQLNFSSWAIGDSEEPDEPTDIDTMDANHLYDKLETTILPLYYQNKDGYIEVMRQAISYNASYFNTQRMLSQYVSKAYFR